VSALTTGRFRAAVPAAQQGRFRFGPILAAAVITVLLLVLFARTADVFLLLFVSVLFALYLGAITDALHARTGLPRRTAMLIALAVTIAAVAGLFWLLVPPTIQQTQALVQVLPTYIVNWEKGIERFVASVPGLSGIWQPGQHRVILAVYEQLSGYFSDLVPKFFSLLHVAINVFSVLVMGIYMTLQPGLYRQWLIALFPPVHRDLVRDVLGDLKTQLRAWIVGQLFAMLLLAILTAIGLYVLQVPYWLTFGVFTGAVAIVPFFGSLVSTVLPALFVLGGDGGITQALLVLLLGVVIHVVEGNIILPHVMARQVHLPPVLTVMSVLIMGKLLGPIGLVVAVPTLVLVMVVVQRILINRIYEGHGFRRVVRDAAFVVRAPAPEGGILLSAAEPPDILSVAEETQRARVA
jgi:predicted PurR-regulated permease PerM